MIVCSCNVLSETAVRSACDEHGGPRSLGQVYRCLGCSPQCGRCARTIKSILDHASPGEDEAAPTARRRHLVLVAGQAAE
ncbi:MAG TPA: (2Fe-2S)-binding protein [Hyphomicrobiales bacterium]|nr:(2Fe-2S)-binding protein [Hyphomicrobiales bacterium]